MRFIASGDMHITDKKPKGRLDENYLETCLKKLDFILNYGVNNNCVALLQPGDLTNQRDENYATCAAIARRLQWHLYYSRGFSVYGVLGQHDTPFHAVHSPNTVHNILRSSGLIHLLGKEPLVIGDSVVHGVSWGEPIPKPSSTDKCNILVMHRMVINGKLWDAQEDYVEAHVLLREHPFDYIITGDNHTSFDVSVGGRKLVNCGSMMRSSVSQKDHKPHFWVIDTEEETCQKVYFPCKPASSVINYEEHEENKREEEDFNTFVASIKGGKPTSLDFRKNVQAKLASSKISEPVAQIVRECVE